MVRVYYIKNKKKERIFTKLIFMIQLYQYFYKRNTMNVLPILPIQEKIKILPATRIEWVDLKKLKKCFHNVYCTQSENGENTQLFYTIKQAIYSITLEGKWDIAKTISYQWKTSVIMGKLEYKSGNPDIEYKMYSLSEKWLFLDSQLWNLSWNIVQMEIQDWKEKVNMVLSLVYKKGTFAFVWIDEDWVGYTVLKKWNQFTGRPKNKGQIPLSFD